MGVFGVQRMKDETTMTVEEKLSEKEQLLLSRFFDGDCGFIGSWRAQKLLARNPLANQFIDNLESIQHMVTQRSYSGSGTVDLWDKIERRINEEQRSELYLGTRTSTESPSLWQNLSETYAMWISGATGATLAAVAIIFLNSSTDQSPLMPQRQSIGRAPVAQQVAVKAPNRQSAIGIPRIQRSRPQSFAFDWMRSEGALHFIPDPNGASTIIWITRNDEAPHSSSQDTRMYSATPLNSTLRSNSGTTNSTRRHRATLPSIGKK